MQRVWQSHADGDAAQRRLGGVVQPQCEGDDLARRAAHRLGPHGQAEHRCGRERGGQWAGERRCLGWWHRCG